MSGNIDNSNDVFMEINNRMKYGAPELKSYIKSIWPGD